MTLASRVDPPRRPPWVPPRQQLPESPPPPSKARAGSDVEDPERLGEQSRPTPERRSETAARTYPQAVGGSGVSRRGSGAGVDGDGQHTAAGVPDQAQE